MTRCDQTKRGKFDRLRCCLESGHAGACNFTVIGVVPCPGATPRKRSDADYERYRARKTAQRKDVARQPRNAQ